MTKDTGKKRKEKRPHTFCVIEKHWYNGISPPIKAQGTNGPQKTAAKYLTPTLDQLSHYLTSLHHKVLQTRINLKNYQLSVETHYYKRILPSKAPRQNSH